MNQIFEGKVQKGKLILQDPNRFRLLLAKNEGKEVELVLRKKKRHRTLNQNAWYWGVIVRMLSEHLGYTADECHFALRQKFARIPERDRDGLMVAESTAAMDTKRFSQYCDEIVRWSAEYLHLYIPSPNEIEGGEFFNESPTETLR